eukprot:c15103_g1_i1.p1 GENE.c15103_g1_i1~~c15103_g1_i1.p1  ORF type:complete len:493 (+),score=74.84 c15103_g1_i1:2-1480(+)
MGIPLHSAMLGPQAPIWDAFGVSGLVATSFSVFVFGSFYGYPIMFDRLKMHLNLSQGQVGLCAGLIYMSCMVATAAIPFVADSTTNRGRIRGVVGTAVLAAVAFLGLAECFFLSRLNGHTVYLAYSASVLVGVAAGFNYPTLMSVYMVDVPLDVFKTSGLASSLFALGGFVFSAVLLGLAHSYPEVSRLAPVSAYACLGLSATYLLSAVLMMAWHYRCSAVSPREGKTNGAAAVAVNHEGTALLSSEPLLSPTFGNVTKAMFDGPLASAISVVTILLTTVMVAVGSANTANIGILATSLGGGASDATRAVFLNLLGSLTGRTVVGIIALQASSWFGQDIKIAIPTLAFVAFGFLVVNGGAWMNGGLDRRHVDTFAILAGVPYGVMWTASGWVQYYAHPAEAAVRWSLINVWVYPFSGVGALLLNLWMARLYEDSTPRGAGHNCLGRKCFVSSFGLLTVASLAFVLLLVALCALHVQRVGRHHGLGLWRRLLF